jgi:hypothetical protein
LRDSGLSFVNLNHSGPRAGDPDRARQGFTNYQYQIRSGSLSHKSAAADVIKNNIKLFDFSTVMPLITCGEA